MTIVNIIIYYLFYSLFLHLHKELMDIHLTMIIFCMIISDK